jgi:hypothetical protein
MYVGNITLVTLIVIALFALPVVVIATRQNVNKPFNFLTHFTKVFNRAFIIQVIVGVLLLISMFIIDTIEYSEGEGHDFFDTFIGTAYLYIVVGVFMYLPALGVLNLINWIVKKLAS